MAQQETIVKALGGLMGWMETWRDDSGAYNGFVIHRTETKRMWRVHDTAWTQSAIIRGYGNLYRKNPKLSWYESMVKSADLFAGNYDSESGRIYHTGHEDERFQSLVSCALGICALMSIIDLVDETRRDLYVRMASDHIKRYWLAVLWIEQEGAFKFSETDFYSLTEDRFVVNFNLMAAEALLAVYNITGETAFREKALAVGNWAIARWNQNQRFNERLLKGKTTVSDTPSSDWMADGGFSYQFTQSQGEHDNYVVLYNGLSLRGFNALFKETKDERYAEIIRIQSSYLLAMRNPETHLFFHTTKKGIIEKNPQFISGAGMLLVGLYEVMPLLGDTAILEDTIDSILSMAHINGSFPCFIGKNDTGLHRRDKGGVVWEDTVASMNWNAQFFEYLTCLIDDPAQIEVTENQKNVCVLTKRFLYRDTPKYVQILSWWPLRSWGIFVYTKKKATAWFSISPITIYSRFRSGLRGFIK